MTGAGGSVGSGGRAPAEVEVVGTPRGEARLWWSRVPRGARPRAHLLLGHGAGGGVDARDLMALAGALPARGIEVVRLEQPWRVAGGRLAPRPAALDEGLLAAWRGSVRAQAAPDGVPLVVGGRSAGARSAVRCATGLGALGCVALAFPLHPPGRPERSREGELRAASVPVLVLQGDRDAFGTPAEIASGRAGCTMVPVPGADHGFAVLRRGPISPGEVVDLLADAVASWVLRLARQGQVGPAQTGERPVRAGNQPRGHGVRRDEIIPTDRSGSDRRGVAT